MGRDLDRELADWFVPGQLTIEDALGIGQMTIEGQDGSDGDRARQDPAQDDR